MTGRANTFFAPLRSLRLCVRLYWRSVSTGHDREIATTGGCPSPMLRMVPLPVPGRNYLAFNSGENCDTPEIGFACNVGFVLRFCALRPQLLRDRLFERVEPQPGFRTR
jgi:hypothetical protein